MSSTGQAQAQAQAQVIIVTGGSRGLGLAIVTKLLEQGNSVSTIARSKSAELQGLETKYTDRFACFTGDVGKVEDNARLVQATVDHWGRLDAIVICAGSMSLERISDLDLDNVPAYTSSNLLSIPYLLKPALPHLRQARLRSDTSGEETGRVVLVSSGASTKGYAAWGMYSMVKAGMNSLARTLAAEEKSAGSGVGVWAIRPGLVDTGMQEFLRREGPGKMNPEDMNKFTTAFEKGDLLPPEKPASTIASLAVRGGPMDLSGEYLDWTDERLVR